MHKPDTNSFIKDLEAEQADLDELVSDLDDSADGGLLTATPAEGWDIRDQISHLAFFDEKAALAVTDPDAFKAETEGFLADPDSFIGSDVARGRAMAPAGVLDWWRQARQDEIAAFGSLDPGARIDWYGPPMSSASFISARIMETWAHGQDVADAIGYERVPTERLRHICHVGVSARPWSYTVRGLEPPDVEVYVELNGPAGTVGWGDGFAESSVKGTTLDFALVVTQRRNCADTELVMTGEAARDWMRIAQAFAGPPGTGRKPGECP